MDLLIIGILGMILGYFIGKFYTEFEIYTIFKEIILQNTNSYDIPDYHSIGMEITTLVNLKDVQKDETDVESRPVGQPSAEVETTNDAAKQAVNPAIEAMFTYHPAKDEDKQKYVEIGEAFRKLAHLVDTLCPNSREKSMAISHLQEGRMLANASIAIHSGETQQPGV